MRVIWLRKKIRSNEGETETEREKRGTETDGEETEKRQRRRERLREKERELCDIYLSDCSAGQDSSTHLNEDRTHLALLRPKIQTKTTKTQMDNRRKKMCLIFKFIGRKRNKKNKK